MNSVANPQRRNSGDFQTSIQSLLLGDRRVWERLPMKILTSQMVLDHLNKSEYDMKKTITTQYEVELAICHLPFKHHQYS